ncbi:nickel pincer cofactor biosynthesis protein LarB [Yeguia hominis]|uniref:Nickel pincer cofactor biosynthesis protein LarB n=1 Tax=Yeguia hominis TaxID=2763662 RepID=A0A926HRY5_9FIRM|nr:nickel pincer cofactor biosynthesis protein LarB [Yeguia hominis]MBC8532821.1 nickel pincer cofactor biosynthesis protein LarB [Yeguia hominis]
MDKRELLQLLRAVQSGEKTPEDALLHLKRSPFDDLGYAKVDNHREIRQGVPEVIYGQNKTPEQICGIVAKMRENGMQDILITRMSQTAAEILGSEEPTLEYHPIPKIGVVRRSPDRVLVGSIVVASGGTSDMAVCEEAALTAETMGNRVCRLYDVGVAGLHRLLANLDKLMQARVVIAVAGMEGALASVLGGLVDCPVIAVPTSVGYGANFGGLSALLSMLNSCASGVSVVNIDNGFGAGYLASMINKMESIKE